MAWKKRGQSHGNPHAKLGENGHSTLGSHYHTARTTLDQLEQRVLRHTLETDFTMKEVLAWVIEPNAHDALTAAGPYADTELRFLHWPLNDVNHRMFGLMWTNRKMVAPAKKAIQFNKDAGAPLLKAYETLEDVVTEFNICRAILSWMTQNATLGAIRHYWPTVMALAPDLTNHMEDLPRRYVEPKANIGPLLPLLRGSDSTVGTAGLLAKVTDIGSYEDTSLVLYTTPRPIPLGPRDTFNPGMSQVTVKLRA